ncbi:MAG: histidine phosphatase family protein [Candidatus Heimdallarchaeota archaeon]|nr:histidine phosphatase family protein [Candidatus Heimdallarchaeota archaeon]
MKIFLVKHGQSEDNLHKKISGHSETPLTDLGREQAKSLGQKFSEKKITFDAVYSSDLLRASETATIVCNEIGFKEIIFDKRLRESDTGIFTGRNSNSITKEEREFLDSTLVDLDKRIPGGETNNEMNERIKEAFFEIINKHPNSSTILIVGHGGTLYHILIRTLNLLQSKLDEWFGSCMINILEKDSQNDSWKVTMFNDKKTLNHD